MGKEQEIETEWKLSGGSKKVNSADRIDQLAALRFKTQMGSKNLPIAKSEEISENLMPGIRKETPKEETYNKYGDSAMKIEIEAIEKHGAFREPHMPM